ncbi:MAG: DUF362 domain-containing protein [Candidatus Mcinerneyibacterium aminivorans]|jgi:uncharacterized protein (DUF362 family)|uniref:DUF362 domain-containing protein n=1 Tax=Candidatus Mcinerneyibacterium aminivorans TaxID=2703815 RepID=A0A5D0MJN9_9BACT|nr:MAG: DUF362 domain-containing protein [Candidatus Mcinerneyibacterium aminivorans]
MDRRDFIKKSLKIIGASSIGYLVSGTPLILGQNSNNYELVAVQGGSPDVMFKKGIPYLGGLKKFIKKGDSVAIKVNASWNSSPDDGGNTNPTLVKTVLQACLDLGAKEVNIFDHTIYNADTTYRVSGIKNAVSGTKAKIVPASSPKYFNKVKIANTKILNTAEVHELVLSADKLINIPVLKTHGSTKMTSAMKNFMGIVWDRSFYHRNGLHRCIAEIFNYRKPDLNIVDAYNVMVRGGPSGYYNSKVVTKKMQLISTDILAVDVAASQILGFKPEEIKYLNDGKDLNLGKFNLDELTLKKIYI